MTDRAIGTREAVRAMITPVFGLAIDNADMRWPRGYAVYGWDKSGHAELRTCCEAVRVGAETPARTIRDRVRGREYTRFTGAPIGARPKWYEQTHYNEAIWPHLVTIKVVLDEAGTAFPAPIDHGFILAWDRPALGIWSCCEMVEAEAWWVARILSITNRDTHLNHT